MFPISLLDLSPITQGSDAAASFRHSRDLAQHAEAWGYGRYWLAEHHGMPGIASAATAVLMAHVASATSRIRIGAGGIMLPNHSPLVIAEQFGTLESLFPGRIDLGLGRAPGSDPQTAQALRRNLDSDPEQFPQDVLELIDLFSPTPRSAVRAVPGTGLQVPIWILGSSLFGAQLAAALGLPFAFASHFAPAYLMQAISVYRGGFRPSAFLARPHLMLGFNVYAADSQAEAELRATSMQQSFVSLRRGRPIQLPPPAPGFRERLDPAAQALLESVASCSAFGDPGQVRQTMQAFIDRTGADELMLVSNMYEHAHRLRSFEIAATVARALRPATDRPEVGVSGVRRP